MSDRIYVEVGNRLRRARETLGWTQSDVETVSAGKFTQQTLSLYERGARKITLDQVADLADLYGVAPLWFLAGLSKDGDQVVNIGGLTPDDKKFILQTIYRFRTEAKEPDEA